MKTITAFLTEFVTNLEFESLPQVVTESAKMGVQDVTGCMLGGVSEPAGDLVISHVRSLGGRPEATIVGTAVRSAPPLSALANGTTAHALDFDDTYDKGGHVHPGTSVLAASLAAGESIGGITGDQLTVAVALGLDVSCRLGLAAYADRGWHRTGAFGIFGATAAAGKLIGLSQEQMVHAFGIAYSQAAGNRQCIVDGALTKRFQAGQAAHGAVLAAFLAKEGFTGAENVFAGTYGFFPMYQPDGYDLSLIDAGLGEEFLGDRISLKPYPCGRPTHSYIDSAVKLHHKLDLGRNALESVTVRTDRETFTSRYSVSSGVVRPTQQVEAQFSLPYLIGCALVLGGVGIDEINSFDEPAVLAASDLVKAETKDGAPKGWAEIQVVCAGGDSATVELQPPSGSPDNPLSTEQLKDKFRDCAAHALHPTPISSVEKMIALILDSDGAGDSRELIDLSVSREN